MSMEHEESFSKENPDTRISWTPTDMSNYLDDTFTYVLQCNHKFRLLGAKPLHLAWGICWDEVRKEIENYKYTLFTEQCVSSPKLFFEALNDPKVEEVCLVNMIDKARSIGIDNKLHLATGSRDDKAKRTFDSLYAAIVWWFDRHWKRPFVLADAHLHDTEVIYKIPDFYTESGEQFQLRGKLDYVARLITEDEDTPPFVMPFELKHSTKKFGNFYVDGTFKYSPQTMTYALCLRRGFEKNGLKYHGINLELCELYVNSTRFTTPIVFHLDDELDLWERQCKRTLKLAEKQALAGELSLERALSNDPVFNLSGITRYNTDYKVPNPFQHLVFMDKNTRINTLKEKYTSYIYD